MVICPSCKFNNGTDKEQCDQCGLIFSKWTNRPSPPPSSPSTPSLPVRSSSKAKIFVLFLLILVAGLFSIQNVRFFLFGTRLRYSLVDNLSVPILTEVAIRMAGVPTAADAPKINLETSEYSIKRRMTVNDRSTIGQLMHVRTNYEELSMTWGDGNRKSDRREAEELSTWTLEESLARTGRHFDQIADTSVIEYNRARANLRDKAAALAKTSLDTPQRITELYRFVQGVTDWVKTDDRARLRGEAEVLAKYPPIPADPINSPVFALTPQTLGLLNMGRLFQYPERIKKGTAVHMAPNPETRTQFFVFKFSQPEDFTVTDFKDVHGHLCAIVEWDKTGVIGTVEAISEIRGSLNESPLQGETKGTAALRLSDGWVENLQGTFRGSCPPTIIDVEKWKALSQQTAFIDLLKLEFTGTVQSKRL